jgi:hypothetical protein
VYNDLTIAKRAIKQIDGVVSRHSQVLVEYVIKSQSKTKDHANLSANSDPLNGTVAIELAVWDMFRVIANTLHCFPIESITFQTRVTHAHKTSEQPALFFYIHDTMIVPDNKYKFLKPFQNSLL